MPGHPVFFAESALVRINPEFGRIDFVAADLDGDEPKSVTVATCYLSPAHLFRLHEAIGRQLQNLQSEFEEIVRAKQDDTTS